MQVKIATLVALLAVASATVTGSSASAQTSKNKPNNKPKQSNAVTVKAGDSLSTIGAGSNTPYTRLYDANPQVADPNVIHPGDQIRIPAPDEQLPDRPLPVVAPAPAEAPVQATVSSTRTYAAPVTTRAGNDVWQQLAACEAGGNWSANTGNGYYGGLQFTQSSWQAAGGSGSPDQASPEEQIARAQVLQSRSGWGNWPACSAKLGL